MVKKTITIDAHQAQVLSQLLSAELHTYRDRQDHAQSHGDLFINPDKDALQTVYDKIAAA